MPRKLRYIIPLLIVFITGVGLIHRIGIIYGGRRADVVQLGSRNQVKFKTVRDLEQAGRLTLLTGSQIMDQFRAQLPVNPHVFAQFINLKLDPDASYILINEPEINQLIRRSLEGARVYRDRYGNKYDGRRYPNAFVLEFDISPENLRDKVVNQFKFPNKHSANYLQLTSQVEVDNFISGEPPEQNINLILTSDLELPALSEKFSQAIDKIYVEGDNARRVGLDDFVRSFEFLYTTLTIPGNYLDGIFPPLGRYFYRWGLLLLGVAVCYLGVFHHEQPLRWLGWLILLAVVSLFFSTHVPALGLFMAGLLIFAWKRKSRRVIWFLLAGVIMFGFFFTPYLLRLQAPASVFWGGFLAGGFVFFPAGLRWERKYVRVKELVYLVILMGTGWLFFYLPPGSYKYLFSDRAWLLLAAPLVGRIIAPKTALDQYLFLTSLGGWLYIFTGGNAYINLIAFIFAIVFRALQSSYLD
ncbi:MAG: hypothetical protein ACQEP7_02370 [bacterium]